MEQIEKKESEWRNILTIVFLVLSPLIGLILMWWLSDWGRKTKRIVTLALGIPVAIAILGVIFSIILVSFGGGGAREIARDARREADVRMISTALEMYFSDNNVYPSSLDIPGVTSFLGEISKDPQTGLPYTYVLQIGGQDYLLCARFEQKAKQKTNCLNSKGTWVAE